MVTITLLEAGLGREEVWPLLSVNKTNPEKDLRKLRRKDPIELALSTGTPRVSERIEFLKAKG